MIDLSDGNCTTLETARCLEWLIKAFIGISTVLILISLMITNHLATVQNIASTYFYDGKVDNW